MEKVGKLSSGKRLLSMLLALSMVLAMLAGCGDTAGSSSSSKDESSDGAVSATETKEGDSPVDLSEKVNLVLYVTGNSPDHFEAIQEKLNELTQRDLNCTVDYNFFNSADNQQKYVLLLSSGEPVDLLYSGNWLNYASNSTKGAFLPIEDLVKNNSPKIWDYVGESGWQAARVDGQAYMIPCMWKEYNLFGFTYREDLREKHNLPLPDSIENMEKYLQGIKDNEPDMAPTAEIVQGSVANFGNYFRGVEIFDSKYRWIDWRMPYGIYIDYDNPTETSYYWESDNFRDDMKVMKKWADAGFWSRNALSDTTDPKDKMLAGTISAQIGTMGYGNGVAYTEEARQNDPNTEMVFNTIPYAYAKDQSVSVHPTQNGISVPISAKNPERAIALWEKILLDDEYNHLVMYGIEGKDYNVVDGGIYENIPGGFPREASRLWCARTDANVLPAANWADTQAYKDKFATMEGPNKIGGFIEDQTPYQAERAAVMNVVSQYLVPIQSGLVSDVDAAIDELLIQADKAGIKKLHEEYLKQWNAHVEANNNWQDWTP